MGFLVSAPPPCVVHEDDQILVVNKPPGVNTHSPSPYAGEGLHEWLKCRERRWASLAIIHRLDKVTSGLLVFAKTREANQSLTRQFATRHVQKRYLLLSGNAPKKAEFTIHTFISRVGEKYLANDKAGEHAETEFRYLGASGRYHLISAHPVTGRTHQIRAHAEYGGFPIRGDNLYGGEAFVRVCLHSTELAFSHPHTGQPVKFQAESDFEADPEMELRRAVIDELDTNAYRVQHSGGIYVERWNGYSLIQSEGPPVNPEGRQAKGVYYKKLNKQVQRTSTEAASPQLLSGTAAPDAFPVVENGVRYEISFTQGYSVGLFLDQRENRRRLLTKYVAPGFELAPAEVLNAFSYTCAFSVCAALAGSHCTSLDLSKKYLDWGQRNFVANGMDPSGHDFIFGDVFEWVPRLFKKGRQFDLILLDPPTFSRSRFAGTFQAERDFGRLVKLVLPALRKGGVLFASTNAHKLAPEDFERQIDDAVRVPGRKITQRHFVPQPMDFPISKSEPAYLKSFWLRVE